MEETGPKEETDKIQFGEEWPRGEVLEKVEIPLDGLRRKSSPAPLVVIAAVLTLMGATLTLKEIRDKRSTPS